MIVLTSTFLGACACSLVAIAFLIISIRYCEGKTMFQTYVVLTALSVVMTTCVFIVTQITIKRGIFYTICIAAYLIVALLGACILQRGMLICYPALCVRGAVVSLVGIAEVVVIVLTLAGVIADTSVFPPIVVQESYPIGQ